MSEVISREALHLRVEAKLLLIATIIAEFIIRRCTRDGRQVFHDPNVFSWVAALERAWPEIACELESILTERKTLPNFQTLSSAQRSITNDDRWKVYFFTIFRTPIPSNCARCPQTAAALSAIPGLQNAMFSILSPRKKIPAHRGPYNGVLRYHLGIKIPQNLACTIDVNGEERRWQAGNSLIFDDSYTHSVSNETDEERVVLFADFERPLRWPLNLLNRWLIRWLARSPLAREPLEHLLMKHV